MTSAPGLKKFQPSGSLFDHFLQQLEPYVSNNAPKILFQRVNRLGFICVDKRLHITLLKIV